MTNQPTNPAETALPAMVEDAVKAATATLTAQNTELNTTLAGLKETVEVVVTAFKNIEAPTPGERTFHGAGKMGQKAMVTDSFVM